MKRILLLIVFIASNYSYSQLLKNYFDFPGELLRVQEEKRARELRNETRSTASRYLLLEATSLVEKASKTRTTVNAFSSAFINYNDYKNVCGSYLNPFKKKVCTNKYNYLVNAHRKVLDLVIINPKHKINKGISEQIGEKYTRITNNIFLELEKLRLQAEKDNFYTRLFIK